MRRQRQPLQVACQVHPWGILNREGHPETFKAVRDDSLQVAFTKGEALAWLADPDWSLFQDPRVADRDFLIKEIQLFVDEGINK